MPNDGSVGNADEARRLIVNADDFGMSAGVNRGILEAHERGIVTSASLMVDRPAAAEAARAAQAFPALGVGLHFELAGGIPSDPDGAAGVRAELRRQHEAFLRLVGAPPAHVDSHHHVHREAAVASLFWEFCVAHDLPARACGAVPFLGWFYGHAPPEDVRTDLYYVSVPFLAALLRDLPPGVSELGCHPGYVTPDISSRYLAEREAEIRTLTDPRIRALIADLGIALVNYASLRPATRTGA